MNAQDVYLSGVVDFGGMVRQMGDFVLPRQAQTSFPDPRQEWHQERQGKKYYGKMRKFRKPRGKKGKGKAPSRNNQRRDEDTEMAPPPTPATTIPTSIPPIAPANPPTAVNAPYPWMGYYPPPSHYPGWNMPPPMAPGMGYPPPAMPSPFQAPPPLAEPVPRNAYGPFYPAGYARSNADTPRPVPGGSGLTDRERETLRVVPSAGSTAAVNQVQSDEVPTVNFRPHSTAPSNAPSIAFSNGTQESLGLNLNNLSIRQPEPEIVRLPGQFHFGIDDTSPRYVPDELPPVDAPPVARENEQPPQMPTIEQSPPAEPPAVELPSHPSPPAVEQPVEPPIAAEQPVDPPIAEDVTPASTGSDTAPTSDTPPATTADDTQEDDADTDAEGDDDEDFNPTGTTDAA